MRVLVTGGAGYIGSTIVSALLDHGDDPVIIDDLSHGPAAFLRDVASFVGDVGDRAALDEVFAAYPDIAAVIHCAARTDVVESLADPVGYYRSNVATLPPLLDALLAHGCHRLVFSSSAAVYGPRPPRVVDEDAPLDPVSPYAATKVMVERMLADTTQAGPLSALSLRYFNPIGTDPHGRTGPYDPASLDVFGRLLAGWRDGSEFVINGRDWDTADGTPIRDFVHVWDVAQAHVAALHRWPLPLDGSGHVVLNVGSGHGTTVRELAGEFARQAPGGLRIGYGPRRCGDTVGCYPAVDRAHDLLGWAPRRTVADGVADGLAWARRR